MHELREQNALLLAELMAMDGRQRREEELLEERGGGDGQDSLQLSP